MIYLDTSVLIDALTGSRRSVSALRAAIEHGERISCSSAGAVEFGSAEAARAAALYRAVRRPRGREIDLAIAASAIEHRARFWTLHAEDFVDIPGP